MWEEKVKKTYPEISKEEVWDIWKNVADWKVWNEDVVESTLNDSFETGGTIKLKLKQGPKVDVTLENVTENKCFTDCVHLPGAKLLRTHEIKSTDEGLEIKTTLAIKGAMANFYIKAVGEKLLEAIPRQLDKLVSLIKQ